MGRLGGEYGGSNTPISRLTRAGSLSSLLGWRTPGSPSPSLAPLLVSEAVSGPDHAELPPFSGDSLNPLPPAQPSLQHHPAVPHPPAHTPSLPGRECGALAPRWPGGPHQQEPRTQGTLGQPLPWAGGCHPPGEVSVWVWDPWEAGGWPHRAHGRLRGGGLWPVAQCGEAQGGGRH